MNWNYLIEFKQLEHILLESETMPVLIFKHSTRCSVSRVALDRLQRGWSTEAKVRFKPYLLDLISYREISNLIAEQFGIEHESPQVLIIKNGESVYDRSHLDIDLGRIEEAVRS